MLSPVDVTFIIPAKAETGCPLGYPCTAYKISAYAGITVVDATVVASGSTTVQVQVNLYTAFHIKYRLLHFKTTTLASVHHSALAHTIGIPLNPAYP